jgi:hypothetical protein
MNKTVDYQGYKMESRLGLEPRALALKTQKD